MEFDWITPQEAAEKWGISDRRVQVLCTKGKVEGAIRLKRGWLIPKDTTKPADGRAKMDVNPLGAKRSTNMGKSKKELIVQSETQTDESQIFERVASIIESRKSRAGAYANREVTLMYWEVGHYVNSVVLDGSRAAYGKRIVTELASQLQAKYGKTFDVHNLRRMMRFAEKFDDFQIVTELASQLSWSHFIEILPLQSNEARMFYANESVERHMGTKELRRQISRKAYERREIADARVSDDSAVPFNVFKDPYLLDVLGLKDNFAEADLEKAILLELEQFILEFGHGFTFAERQKRMTMDGDDFTLDLLFFHRTLRRLVAVELKIGRFKPQYMGQMRFYLKWLDRYERQEHENPPIGIILCTTASREQIELLELDKEGIAVAEYWTAMPPKAEFERKIREILEQAKERLARRKLLTSGDVQREIEYFYESKDDDED
jgi:predicted nuclease of restriction endonuclease-like (RecB) superfamily